MCLNLFLFSDMSLVYETDDEHAPSPAENLYMLLYELNIAERLGDFTEMFDNDIIVDHIIKPNCVALQPLQSEYEEIYSSSCLVIDGMRYVHVADLYTDDVLKRKLLWALEKIPNAAFR